MQTEIYYECQSLGWFLYGVGSRSLNLFMTQHRKVNPLIVKGRAYYKYEDIVSCYQSAKKLRTNMIPKLTIFLEYAKNDRKVLSEKYGIKSITRYKDDGVYEEKVDDETKFYTQKIDAKIEEIEKQIKELQEKLDKLNLLKQCI